MPSRQDYRVKAVVSESGNSDVDVNVVVDTSALAYAFAAFMYADGRLTKTKYDQMVRELEKYSGNRSDENNSVSRLINQTKYKFINSNDQARRK